MRQGKLLSLYPKALLWKHLQHTKHTCISWSPVAMLKQECFELLKKGECS